MSNEEKKFLSVNGLKKSFGSGDTKQEVLKGLDFTVGKGEFCVLLGPSGSGKSTLLNILGGIDNADEGEIIINGDKLAEMDEKSLTRYRRKHLGYVFQMYNLIPNLNVKENIETGAFLSDKPLDIDELLKILGLYEHRHKLPNQLSGGQQQRVAIARALVMNPGMLFFDEPTSALDPEITADILRIMKALAKEKMTMVIVTHEIDFARAVSDRVIFMDGGFIVEQGKPEDVIDNPKNERTRNFLKKLTV